MDEPVDELREDPAYRDSYSVWIEGPALDRDRVEAILDRLRRDRAAEAGSEARRRRALERGLPFPPPATGHLSFQEIRIPLAGLLRCLLSRQRQLLDAGMAEVAICASLTRGAQLGSELSRQEIALLHELGATFCWTMILEEEA